MKVLYVESSAVLAWLFGESRSREVAGCINRADTVVTSALTAVETERALIRAEEQNLLTAGDCQKLRGLFARAVASWMLMEISEDVRTGACRKFPLEPVRTLDALHLATALIFLQAYPDLRMLTYDQRMMANAEMLGIG